MRPAPVPALVAILAAAYVGMVLYFGADLALQDSPNHLARGVVMADLLFHRGRDFAPVFSFQFEAVPYVLGDLALATLIGVFGANIAAGLWGSFVLLSLPLAIALYLRSCGASRARCALGAVLGLYLATDWFFVKGFFTFRLAIALILVVLVLARSLRTRWSTPLYLAYLLAVAAGYLLHLTATVFATGVVGLTALLALRTDAGRLPIEGALLAPFAVVLLWYVATAHHHQDPLESGPWFFATLADKLRGLDRQFMRYNPRDDELMMIGLAACIGWPLRRGWAVRDLARPAVLEALLLSGAFTLLYFVLPVGRGNIWFVDARAMEMAALFAIMAALVLGDGLAAGRGGLEPLGLALGFLVAVLNLAYLAKHFVEDARWLNDYRRVVAVIPRGAWVLPVYNSPLEGSVRPFLHAGSFVVIDRGAFTPYLFSLDNGDPMTYFRYVMRPYVPVETWYHTGESVDWAAVACAYDYILIANPFDRARLGVRSTLVAADRAASLLEVQHGACAAPGKRR